MDVIREGQDIADAPWWAEFVAQYKEAARFVRGARLLDLGCRSGYGSRYLFDHGANEVVGLDLNGSDIVIAQQNYGRDGVSFIIGDAINLPFPAKSFDAVTCFQVLESTASSDRILQQIKRILVPGGTAILTTVNRRRQSGLAHAPLEPEHIQEFDLDEWRRLLKNYFSAIEIQGLVRTRPEGGNFLGAVSRKIFKSPESGSEHEFSLRGTAVGEAPLFFAVCRA